MTVSFGKCALSWLGVKRLIFVSALILVACNAPTGSSQMPNAQSFVPGGRSPHATPVTAEIHFHNRIKNVYVKVWAQWAYDGSPIWFDEATQCVAPASDWNTSIVFHRGSGPGPQVRILAQENAFGEGDKNCDGFFKNDRSVKEKDFPFYENKAVVESSYSYKLWDGFTYLCIYIKGTDHYRNCDCRPPSGSRCSAGSDRLDIDRPAPLRFAGAKT